MLGRNSQCARTVVFFVQKYKVSTLYMGISLWLGGLGDGFPLLSLLVAKMWRSRGQDGLVLIALALWRCLRVVSLVFRNT